jgi:osmotically-inducible protein OsmY
MSTVRDEAIIQLVRSRLDQDKLTGGETIYVTLENGDVILIGWCDREEQKIAAERIVKGTYGVTNVISRIRVRKLKWLI